MVELDLLENTQTETLSEKMKRFESEVNVSLKSKTPVIIRIDGKAFHTFTKGLDKPFDSELSEIMINTALSLAENIQNVRFVYSQSDEISLLLTDWTNPNTDTWYGYRVQKITSVSSSMATLFFSKYMRIIESRFSNMAVDYNLNNFEKDTSASSDLERKWWLWLNKSNEGALFDSRAFNLPKEEVSNYFLWRYKDAKRNSVQALAQSVFSQKELQNKSTQEQIDMIREKSGIVYDNLTSLQKVGFAIYKKEDEWFVDTEVPDLYENRDYVEKWLN